MAGSSPNQILLPAANVAGSGHGQRKTIKNVGSGNVVVQTVGTNNIRQSLTLLASLTLTPGQALVLVSDGVSVWDVVSLY